LLFPEPMIRLVWFVPESKLTDALARLADSHGFHLSEQCHLGSAKDLDALKAAYREHVKFRQQQRILQLLARFPDRTLLNYAVGVLPAGVAPCEGMLVCDDGSFFWAGSGEPPEPVRSHACSTEQQKTPPELPMECSDTAWGLLFASEASIGRVASWAVICGWFPASRRQYFERLLANTHSVMTPAEISGLPLDEVPVIFTRPAYLRGFAALMRTYAITGYREIDPTALLAAGFVAMFGMMFADLGQGLVMFFSALAIHGWARRSGRHGWLGFSLVLAPIGLSAALFGALFGSFFGYEDVIPVLWFHPMDQILFYLGASIFVGMATILTGMGLGLFNHWRMHRLRRLAWAHFGIPGLLFYSGLAMCALDVAGVTTGMAMPGLLLCGLTALAVGAHEAAGPWRQAGYMMRLFIMILESFEFAMKFLVQTISFARIAAFTIAHLALSSVVIMATESASSYPVLAALVFVLGNALIILGEGALVAIQVLRLHFFEFFTKFVQGEGTVFTPFGAKEKPA